MELLHERIHVQLDLLLEELVFQRFIFVALALAFKNVLIVRVVVGDRSHLIVIVRFRQSGQTVRIQIAAFRIQFGSRLAVQFGAERVDRDDERSTIGFERYLLGGREKSKDQLNTRSKIRRNERALPSISHITSPVMPPISSWQNL